MRLSQNAPYDVSDAERVEPIAARRRRLLAQTAELYGAMVAMVNDHHTEGFGEQHPELVGQLMLSHALHSFSEGVDAGLLGMRDQAAALVDVVDALKGVVRQLGKTLASDD